MPVGTPGFQGKRLKQARDARGLTSVALSELVDISTASITQYEKGHSSPPREVLEKLAEKLNLRMSFFLRPIPERPSKIFYRSMSSATKAARTRSEGRFDWFKENVDYLNGYFDFPSLNLPT